MPRHPARPIAVAAVAVRDRLAALTAVLLAAALLVAVSGRVAHAAKPVAVPKTPGGLPSQIEPLAEYVGQTACSPTTKAGTAKLAGLLVHTYPDTTAATVYACGTDGSQSEHYEGRAIDWMVSALDTHHLAEAQAAIKWLLATDAQGNRFAMARRLGVMYLIFDNRMWGAWDGRWEEYNNCKHTRSHAYDNACHRTHVHVSLSWNGAQGRTSFWTDQVAATDYGPCRPSDLNWARYRGASHPRVTPCPDQPRVNAPKGASATKVALVQYSGSAVRNGWLGGPAVSAVQRALHVSASGVYSLATVLAVQRFQLTHSLVPTGIMFAGTWRALLKATH